MDPATAIGLAASILQLSELPGRTVKLIALWRSNPGVRQRLYDDAVQIEENLRKLQADGGYQDVFEQSQQKLRQVKTILESMDQPPPSCSRCPNVLTSIWDCVRSSRLRGKLDDAQRLLDTLLNQVILTAVSSVDHRVPRPAANLPLLPSIDIGFHRVQEILDFLGKEKNGVRVVGIYGQGGLGKTTLLNKTIQELSKGEGFSKSAYVEVKEKPDDERVKTLQSSILQQLGGFKTEMQSIPHGKGALRDHLLKLKDGNETVCLAIDNLWEEADLEQLLPDELASILPPSSSLIITTRFLNVVEKLDQLCSSPRGDQFHKFRYRPKELSPKDSKDLFMKNASKTVPLTDVDLPLVNAIVPLCGGLPLAVEILGSLFSTESSRGSYHWKDVERRLRADEEENLPTGIDRVFKVLQLSYKGLKPNTKKAFLDAAHFFSGWEWHTVRHILGNDEMVELENSSLLTRSVKGVKWGVMQKGHPCREGGMEEEETVRIHDLTLRLGKDLAEQDHVEYVVKKSSLDSIVHDEPEELKKVRAVWLSDSPEMIDADKVEKVGIMKNLRILHLEGSSTEDNRFDMRQLKQLRYLRLSPRLSEQRATSELFSEQRGGDSLRFLSLARIKSSLTEAQLSSQLRELHLHDCSNLVELPTSSSQLKMLERLHIHGCASFSKLPQICGNWEQLQEIVIIGANRMAELPTSIGNLGFLKLLSLLDCGNLAELPPSSSQLKKLERLRIEGCASFSRLPEDCGDWERLQDLVIIGASRMTELPVSIGNLGSLELLSLADCGNLVELPSSSSQLKKLERLHIDGCASFSRLPEDCGDWERLQQLVIIGAIRMTELPASIGHLGSLKLFHLAHCYSVVSWPPTFWNLKSLESLKVEHCSSLANLLAVPSCVAKLVIANCHNLVSIGSRDHGLPVLETASLSECSGGLVESILQMRDLNRLRSLEISGCDTLKALPPAIGQLCALEELELNDCKSLTELPEELGYLSSLKKLCLRTCKELLELPEGIGNLTSLRELQASSCEKLQKLPPTIRNAVSLEELKLWYCDELLELPEGLGELRCLRKLDLSDCKRLRRLPNVGSQVKLDVSGCTGLEWTELPTGRDFRDQLEGWRPPMEVVLRFENLEHLEVKVSDKMSESQWREAGEIASLQRLVLVDDDGTSSTLPSQAFMLSQLRALEIQDFRSLREWPDVAWSLPLLERLKLKGLQNLICLPSQVSSLGNLQSLQLLRCWELQELPPDFNQLGLKSLTLECSSKLCFTNRPQLWPISLNILHVHLDLQDFSPQIGQLQALEELALRASSQQHRIEYDDGFYCELICKVPSKRSPAFASLPSHIGDLLALKKLHLIGLEGLRDLPAEIGKLTNLERLELIGLEGLRELPAEIGKLTKLCQLELRECRSLRGLPGEGIGQLVNLWSLWVENCDALESLPLQIGRLTKLVWLLLPWCWSLQELPSEVGNLVKLKLLHLNGCMSLRSLPSSLASLIHLNYVYVRWCPGLRHSHIDLPLGCRHVYKDQKLVTWKTRVVGIVACQELFKRRSLQWRW